MLTTLAKIKAHLEIPALDLTLDTKLTALGEAATKAICKYCNANLEQISITQLLNGGTTELILRDKPTSLTSVLQDGVAVACSYYEYSLYKTDKSCFNDGFLNIAATYQTGYTSANVPSDLEYALWLLIEYYFRLSQDRRLGRSNVSKNGESVSFVGSIPDDIKILLENYRKVGF